MSKENKYFVKDNNVLLPVNLDKFLFPALSSTSVGTNYWDSPPPSKISDNQLGRILLQVHQILDLFSLNQFQRTKILLILEENGMIPRLLLNCLI